MASYGSIFEFIFDSTNGAEINIVILRRDYNGSVVKRSLGRAPILRLENNDKIFGTSLEIYAECLLDGEYAALYSSSAYEHKVEVYKDNSLIWEGYVSPELYSEPDIDPPYDVQIVATDGLGELKDYTFEPAGAVTIWSHLSYLLSYTGLDLQYDIVSELSYQTEEGSIESDLLNITVDLDHESGSSCYDVLQRILTGLNMSITQRNGRWLLFRETDLITLASEEGVRAYDGYGMMKYLPVVPFGSAKNNKWWPVGQLSTVIEPAKNKIILESPNHYKNNILLSDEWSTSEGAAYDDVEGSFVLSSKGSSITQKITFDEKVGYRLGFVVRARNVGSGEVDQDLGIRIKIDAQTYTAATYQFWLRSVEASDRGIAGYGWIDKETDILANLAAPQLSDTSADAQDVEIIIPLHVSGGMSVVYAHSVEVTIFNPSGSYDINIYDVAIAKYDQYEGLQGNVQIGNNARESASTIDLSFTDGSSIPAAGNLFMTGIPMSNGGSVIKSWLTTGITPHDYLSFMAYDYSRAVALPRMRYKGTLNVPKISILPMLYHRNGTYYIPMTYSYNLLEDELEIDMLSISDADVNLDHINITQMTESSGAMPGTSGGGGIGSSANGDITGLIENYLSKATELLSWFKKDSEGNIYTDVGFYSKKTLASGGVGVEGEGGGGTDVDILYNWLEYNPALSQVLSASLGIDLNHRVTALEEANPEIDLSEYATIKYVGGEIDGLIDGASFDFNTLGKIENSITDVVENIVLLEANVAKNTQSLAQFNGTITNLTERVAGLEANATDGVNMIYLGDSPYSSENGVITLPKYPSQLSDLEDGSSVVDKSALGDYLLKSGGIITGSLSVDGSLSAQTINGYTLAEACEKNVTSNVASGSSALITSSGVYSALQGYQVKGNTIFLKSDAAIQYKDSVEKYRTILQLNTSATTTHNLLFGQGTAAAGYPTYIYGQGIVFSYKNGSATYTAMKIDDDGNITIYGNLSVLGTVASGGMAEEGNS